MPARRRGSDDRLLWALDTRDWDALDRVFLPGATADLASSTTLQGAEAIKTRVARALVPLDDSPHMVTNHQIDVDAHGEHGTCRCYVQAQYVRHGVEGGENFIIGGRYEDRVVRTPDGWRMRSSHAGVDVARGQSAVLHPPQPST